MKNKLVIYNTKTKEKEPFLPQHGEAVSVYVCGVTPYNYAHIGHARCYVHFDTVVRLLRNLGYTVHYVRNITDVDDKLIAKAFEQGATEDTVREKVIEIGTFFSDSFNYDMKALNCVRPDHEPAVSDHVAHIISLIVELIEKHHAYVVGGDVYFDTSTDPKYGELSRKNLDELQAGARVAVAQAKRTATDFVLWKSDERGVFWQSPWGNGRPGWHIECSSFINEYIGDTVDIHGGGIDLLFPHHENERAQSECAHDGTQLARYWMHNAHVTLGSEKMSKSLGNVRLVTDVLKQFAAPIVRLFFLQHHYRTPIDFSTEHLRATEKAYRKMLFLESEKKPSELDTSIPQINSLMAALCDDLNASKALGLIFGCLKEAKSDKKLAANIRYFVEQVLGIEIHKEVVDQSYSSEVQKLIEERSAARQKKDWKAADAIRDTLISMGVTIIDQ